MAEPARYDDTLVAGDTYPMTITLEFLPEKVVLDGKSVFHIRRCYNEKPVLTIKGVHASKCVIVFELSPQQTRQLDSARDSFHKFVYNIQFTSSNGKVQTLLVGELRVLRDLAV